jgi:hypothetical protein
MTDLTKRKRPFLLTTYHRILEVIPDLDRFSKWATAESSQALVELATLVCFHSPSSDITLIRIQA